MITYKKKKSPTPSISRPILSTKSIGAHREVQNFRYLVVPPDGGWGWLIVGASFFVNFVADGTMYTFGLFLPEIKTEFKSSSSSITVANSLMTGLYYLTGPIVCAMINRLSFRKVGCIGAILSTVCFLSVSFVTDQIQYTAVYGVLGGLGFSMCYLPAILIVGFYFERWRAAAISIAVCGSSIGTIVFPLIFTALLNNKNWRYKYRVLAGFSAFMFFCSLVYKPIKPVKITDDTRSSEKSDTMFASAISSMSEKIPFRKMHNKDYPTNAESGGGQEYQLEEETDSGSRFSQLSIESIAFVPSVGFVRNVKSEDDPMGKRRRRCCPCTHVFCRNILPIRPMYKDDIFFQGSLAVLPIYGQKAEADLRLHRTIDYNLNTTRPATVRDIRQEGKCVCCPESVMRTLVTMMDFSLLKSKSFSLLLISGFFTYLAFYVPYIYIVQRSIDNGMDALTAPYILSIMGAASTIGRILCGVVTLSRHMTPSLVTLIGLSVAGGGTVATVFLPKPIYQFIYGGIYALCLACVPALRTIMIVQILGLDKLTNAVGLMQLSQGVACLAGQPVASFLRDHSNTTEAPLLFAGVCLLISAILVIPIPKLMKREKNKALQKEKDARQIIEDKLAKANAALKEAPKRTKKTAN